MHAARRWILFLALPLLGVVFSLALLEAGVRLVTKADGSVHRGTAGMDPLQFRDTLPAAGAPVVAIGDSQTWGVNAAPTETWPAELARRSGVQVVNLGVSGHGPVEYRSTAALALSRSPRVAVVGLYFGNDLWDAYSSVYLKDDAASLRRPDAPEELFTDTIGERSRSLMEAVVANRESRDRIGAMGALGERLVRHSALARFLRDRGIAFRPAASPAEADRAWAERSGGAGMVYERGGVSDVLVPGYREAALDLDDVRIAEGMRITSMMLDSIRADAERSGARLVVLLIPTKERVYAGVLRDAGALEAGTLLRLAEAEDRARARVVAACDGGAIECVDPLPVLVRAIGDGQQIYPPYVDGHFNSRGYQLLGSALHEAVRGDTLAIGGAE